MPPRRRGGKRGGGQAGQDAENVSPADQPVDTVSLHDGDDNNSSSNDNNDDDAGIVSPQLTSPKDQHLLGESTASVLHDEEDSYRLVWEHDEHLERIRAYTDFFDQLALMTKALGQQAGARERSPAPQKPPAAEYTPTRATMGEEGGDGVRHSESALRQLSPFTSVDRAAVLATVAPPGAYGEGGGALVPTEEAPLFALEDREDGKRISQLVAEKTQLAQQLHASQETIQELQASLQRAREAAMHSGSARRAVKPLESTDDDDYDYEPGVLAPLRGSAGPSQRAPLASPSSVSSLTNSASHPQTPLAPDAFPESAAAAQRGGRSPTRSHTQQFVPLPNPPAFVPPPPPQQRHNTSSRPLHTRSQLSVSPPRHPRRASPSPGRHGGAAAAAHAGQPSGQKPIDVAEFFWSLQVAPPPTALHARCGYADHCHAASGPSSPSTAHDGHSNHSSGGGGVRAYGTVAGAAPLTEEEAALACESAWVDSSFYCYNIMEELSCLRVVRAWEDVVDDGAAADGTRLAMMSEEEVMRLLLDRTPASGRSPASSPPTQSLPFLLGPTSSSGQAPYAVAAPHSVPGSVGDAAIHLDGTPLHSSAMAPGLTRRLRLPYLQRLWVTSVLRQYLLFLLLTITCALLLIPGMVLGAVNVFEAADGDDFYATRNRFGRSALLVVARLGSCCLVFLLFFGTVCAEGGRRQPAQTEPPASLHGSPAEPFGTATPLSAEPRGEAAVASSAAGESARRSLRPTTMGTVVHLMLCVGAGLLLVGSFLFYRGCAARSLVLAVIGMAIYGAGEALVLGGVGTVLSAEVGVAAGVSVSLLILLANWLLVNAFGTFVFPKLSYYVYSPAQLVRSQVHTTGILGAFVFALVMLSPRDLIERAGQANAKFLSPRKLLSAARHDVSLNFYFRALTVGLLIAAGVLLLITGAAVFVPSQAEAASIAESAKSKELMGTGSGKHAVVATESNAAAIAGSADRWASQQRHAVVYFFAFATLLVPPCFIPRLAAVINRWCPVALLTTLLCAMWSVSTASSWATVLGLSAQTIVNAAPISVKKTDRLWRAWIWTGRHNVFTPSMQLCGMVTGVVFTIVVSSLLRSIANAGVQLPVSHPARWRMALNKRDRRRLRSDSMSSFSLPTEASPLVSGSPNTRNGRGGGGGEEHEKEEAARQYSHEEQQQLLLDAEADEARMRCVRMQLRGGPAVMTVLVALLIMIVLATCITVTTIAAAMLTDRDENPVYVNAVMPGVTWDEHLLAKSVVTGVLALAMFVQWLEVFHRLCCACCCCCC